MQGCAVERHASAIKAQDPGRAGWVKQRAWAGVKDGVGEASIHDPSAVFDGPIQPRSCGCLGPTLRSATRNVGQK